MSLINQMLSDLEARRLDRSDDSDRALEGLHCARSELREDAEPNSANRFLAAAFIGIVTACLAWYGLNLIDRDALADQNTQSHSFDALQPITDLEPVPQERTENLAEQEATDPSETAATSAPIKTEDNVYPAEHLPPPVLDEALELAAVKPLEPDEAPSVDEPLEPVSHIADVPTPADVTMEYGGTMRMVPRQEDNDRAGRLAEALMLSRHGRIEDALIALASLVEDHPGFVPAREAYAHELLRRGEREPAERVLRGGLALNPREHRYALVLAHVLYDRGATDDALKSLLIAAPTVQQDVEYHAFIAALQQRQGRHDAAIAAYRGVLAAAPDRGEWWMGLAISLAAQNRAPQAHSAFQRALVDRDLSDNLRDYAKREISRLSGNS